MTYYVRPKAVLSGEGMLETTNIRFFMRRAFDKLGYSRGVLSIGTIMARNTTERWIVMTDAMHDLLDASPSAFDPADTVTQTTPTSPALLSTSDLMANANDGLCNVVWDIRGTSLVNGVVGSATVTELQNPINRYWAQLLLQGTAPCVLQEDSDALAPDIVRNGWFWHPKSALVRNWGRDSQRMWSKPGVVYGNGVAWLDHYQDAGSSIFFPGQTHNVLLDFGTNDVAHAALAGYPFFATPPQGSPNLIDDCLLPTIAAEKSLDPSCNIYVMTPIAREFSSLQSQNNQMFIDYADWVEAHKADYGVVKVVHRKNYPEFDPRQAATVTANPAFYQSDGVHLMPAGYAKLAGYDRVQLGLP